jgi:hypothetical protein
MADDKTLIDAINLNLKQNFTVLDGRPIYRLVWSDDLTEKRIGTFTDWYGHIMIRQEHKALREVKKYWYITPPCWILEKLVFVSGYQALKDIVEELEGARNGLYETLYAFRNPETGALLPVNQRVVDIILHTLHNPQKRMSKADFDEMQRLEEEKEVNFFEEKITEEGRSDLFLYDLGQFVSTNQMKYRKEMEYKTPLDLIEKPEPGTYGNLTRSDLNGRPILSS